MTVLERAGAVPAERPRREITTNRPAELRFARSSRAFGGHETASSQRAASKPLDRKDCAPVLTVVRPACGLVVSVVLFAACALPATGSDWPTFRGPDRSGRLERDGTLNEMADRRPAARLAHARGRTRLREPGDCRRPHLHLGGRPFDRLGQRRISRLLRSPDGQTALEHEDRKALDFRPAELAKLARARPPSTATRSTS